MTWFLERGKTAIWEHLVAEMETIGGAIEDVRAFCAVIEHGTVSAAARLLGETKGGVSRRLSRLERRLGAALLARTSRAVTPTEEGLAFHARAREALVWLDDAAEGVTRARVLPQGHLRVTAPIDLGMDVLPAILVRFRAAHPQITIELLITDAPLDLAANRVDLALRATAGDLPDMGYRASTVARFRIGLYAAPDYLARRGEPAAPADLAGHDFAVSRDLFEAARITLRDPRGRSEQVAIRAALRTSDYGSALRLAVAGGGVAPVPDMVAAGGVEAGWLRRVLPQWHTAEGRLSAISLGGRDAPARVRVFREFLRAALSGRDVQDEAPRTAAGPMRPRGSDPL